MGLRRDSNSAKMLQALTVGAGFMVLSLVSPRGGAIVAQEFFKSYFRRKVFERNRLLRDVKNLQSKELIRLEELGDGKVKILITDKGKKKALTYKIEDIKLDRSRKWDRKWRLIIFDIPESHKDGRNALREKLNSLRFYTLQKSVYITPFPCEDEINFITTVFDVQKYVLMMTVSYFEGGEKLRKYFSI